MKTNTLALVLACLVGLLFPGMAFAQTDPGVRPGAINGQPTATAMSPLPLASVAANNPSGSLEFFQNGLARFQEIEVVSGGTNNGLGPRFNFNQCSGCHAQPTIGGTGPANNPQFQVIANGIVSGSTNSIPSFITVNGPTREARFPFFFNSNGSPNTNAPNGGVEDLFTVSSRPDAGSCSLPQPSFSAAESTNNIIFRIPTPLFGAGLLENIDDSTLIGNHTAQARNSLGISGTFNHNGNDGTISRFGWKAQNKSLLLFAGEAYNVEMGITNEIFGQDRPLPGEDQMGSGLPSSLPESFGNRVSRRRDQLYGRAQFGSFSAKRASSLRHRFVCGVYAATRAANTFDDDSGRGGFDFPWTGALHRDRMRDVPHADAQFHTAFERYALAGEYSGERVFGH